MNRLRAGSRVALAVLALAAPGCGWILGLDEFTDQPPPAGSGGQSGVCEPGAMVSCYDGPEGTEGVGLCKAGTALCNEDGMPGVCEGQATPATETCVDPADEDCDGQDCVIWGRLFGDISNQSVTDVAADAHGNLYITGSFNGTLAFGSMGSLSAGAGENIYIAKLDPQGNAMWSRGFNSAELRADGIALDQSGNVIVTGTFWGSLSFGGPTHQTSQFVASAAFVLKLTTEGIYSWSDMHENQEDFTHVVRPAIDSSGAVILLGDSFCGPSCGLPAERIWLRKYAPDGTLSWFKNFPYSESSGERRAGGVVVDSNDAIFMTGEIGGPFGNATTDFGGPSITCSNNADVFVVKLDPTGGFVWQRFINGPGDQTAADIARDSMDQPVVLGTYDGSIQSGPNPITSAGGTDIFVVKYSVTGTPMWSRSFGSAGEERAKRLGLDRGDAIVFTGESAGDVDYGGGTLAGYGGIDIPLVKLAPDGAHGWSKLFGSALDQTAQSVCVAPDDTTVLAGNVQGSVDLGSGIMFSNGGTDALLAKLAR